MGNRISAISFSEHGFKFQDSLRKDIEQWAALQDMETYWYCKDKIGFGVEGYIPVMGPTKEWAADRFEDSDIIIFFCTVAKAVRNFAPSMKGHITDPAVLAIDQQGRFSIPVLSGKKGEAYELSLWLKEKAGITAVNSGEEGVEYGFSVEKYAERNNMVISNASYAKEITAALDSGEKICFYTNLPVKGDLPEGFDWAQKGPLGINLSPSYRNAYFEHTLWLIPKCVEIGISIDETVVPRDIENELSDLLKELSIYPESICSINAVESENLLPLQALCESNDYNYSICPQEEIETLRNAFPGKELFELAAVKSGNATLIGSSSTGKGISIAAALKRVYLEF